MRRIFDVEIKTTEKMEKILIGGQALIKLGSSRGTEDTDYLVCINDRRTFIHESGNVDIINGGGCAYFAKFFKLVFNTEKGKEIASAQSLLDLKTYAYFQHIKNENGQKAADAKFDIEFLVRNYGIKSIKLVKDFLTKDEQSIINDIIKNTF